MSILRDRLEQEAPLSQILADLPCVPDGVHGSLDWNELDHLGLDADGVLDFSSNVNAYGPPDAVRQAMAGVPLDRYPDRQCLALRRALAERQGVTESQILPGNGVSELIGLTAQAFVRPGDRVFVLGPTYCEYGRAASLNGARVTTSQARQSAGFVPASDEVIGQLTRLRPRLAFVCNPNNPTGTVVTPATIADWARRCPSTLFVVDEAYLPFAAGVGSVLDFAKDNLLILRSMTKDCGLAGLRLGYAMGHQDVIAALRRMQPPWSVNAMAQAAGVAALSDSAATQVSLECLGEAKRQLVQRLTRLGLACLPSATHFFLMGARRGDASVLRKSLLQRGMLVRDGASFGLPSFVRIAARRPEENERLLAVLREVP